MRAIMRRRDFLQLSVGIGASAIGSSGCDTETTFLGSPMCTRFEYPVAASASYVAAAFEVDARGAIICAHGPTPGKAKLEIRPCRGSGDGTDHSIEIAQGSLTGSVLLDGLPPNRGYYYRVSSEAYTPSDWGWFQTAPEPTHDVSVHFVYSADIGLDPERETSIVEFMAESPAAFYMNLGDWPYADKDPAARTLSEYRAKHRAVREPAWIRGLLRRFPVYAIYDDHDIRCNWDGKWRERESERIAAGLTAWDEAFPLRTATRYRDWRWGRHAHFFMLDTRMYRSANEDPDGPDKTMLGPQQKEWLLSGLRSSESSFKFVISSVPLGFATGNDHWSAFATERDEVVSTIRDEGIRGVVFLTADRHYFAAVHHSFGIREFHVGPLSAGPGNPPERTAEVLGFANTLNYGEVRVQSSPDPLLTFNCRDSLGEILYTESFTPEEA